MTRPLRVVQQLEKLWLKTMGKQIQVKFILIPLQPVICRKTKEGFEGRGGDEEERSTEVSAGRKSCTEETEKALFQTVFLRASQDHNVAHSGTTEYRGRSHRGTKRVSAK